MKTPETFKDFILRVHPDPDSITHIRTGRRTEEYLESEAVYKLAEQYVKSMQEDHEKELSSIREGVEQVMRDVVSADPTLHDVCLTIIRDDIKKVLTQFRNKPTTQQ